MAGTGNPQDMVIQFIPLIVLTIIWLIPCLRILSRIGRSRWWGLLFLVPFLGWAALLWFIAYSRWPKATEPAQVF
jgi:hypothetical protein